MCNHPELGPNDHPFEEIVPAVEEQIKKGNSFYQKWTCAHCGSRQTMSNPNLLYEIGKCENCNLITDIKFQGCNYLLLIPKFKGYINEGKGLS